MHTSSITEMLASLEPLVVAGTAVEMDWSGTSPVTAGPAMLCLNTHIMHMYMYMYM